MACERYSDRIAGVALGTLPASEDAELVAHLDACDACRAAYRRAGEVATLVDRGVSSLVEGAPSAAFVVRLRARLAEEAAPMRWAWGTRIAAAAGGFALAGALFLGAIHLVRGGRPNTVIAWRTSPPALRAAGISAMPHSPLPIRRARVVRSMRSAHANESLILVDPGQLAAVREFASAVATGRVNGKQLVAGQRKVEQPLEIGNLEIPPLKSEAAELAATDAQGGL